jgi:N-acetylmuramoyl-L-alanine amidase
MRALLALILLSCSSAMAAPLTVVVDPGHGGAQVGAQGPNKTWEKDLTLAISKKLASKLRSELGAQALLTREADEPVALGKRVEFANKHAADLFISIHLNSLPTYSERQKVVGIETYFLSASASSGAAARVAAMENADESGAVKRPKNDVSMILDDLSTTEAHHESSKLAYSVQDALCKALPTTDRGVQQAPFAVLYGAAMPAVLVEVGFISHPGEGARLGTPEYQDQIAAALLTGIRAFLVDTGHPEYAAKKPAK